MAMIEQMRRMEQESLQAWASDRAIKAADDIGLADGVRRAGKKTPMAQHLW